MPTSTQPLKFNFHNVVAAQVYTGRPEDAAFFAAEYNHHLAKQLPERIARVIFRFQRRSDQHSIPAGFTQHTHKLLARWSYRIEIRGAEIEIEVIGNQMAVPMVHHMLLHPSLRYLSSQNGLLMLHAGAVAHQGHSLIFTGHGGAGKTTTTSLLLSEGGASWSPHADDYVFLQKGPESLAYMTRSHLYRSLLNWVPELRQRLTAGERLRLEFFGSLRKWSREGIKWPVRLPIERLWPGRLMAYRAVPVGLVKLIRTEVQAPQLRVLGSEEMPLDELIEMNFREARYFLSLLRKGEAIQDLEPWTAQWRACERQLLQERFEEMPVYLLELPKHYESPQAYRRALAEKLIGLVSREAKAKPSSPLASSEAFSRISPQGQKPIRRE